MRPIWKGHLTFGLVTIPIKLYTATDSKDIRFRLLHKTCLTPIQNKRYCPNHEQIVDWNDVVRGYEYAKGKFVPLTEDDLESVPLDTAGTVSVTSFVTLSEISPLYYEKSYYLAPDEGGQKAFRLLHDTMTEASRVAVGKVVIKEKEHLVSVRPHDGALVLSTLYYADEVRAIDEIPELPVQTKIHPNEKKMALQLIEGLVAEFAPAEYTDDYRQALEKVINAKIEGETIEAPARRHEKVVDLMEALRRSLQVTRKEKPARRSRPAARAAAMRERHR
ncbi:MAG: Ku protein [Armatimonadetes bacterium]|nr:Ku protein [Armatimonadota bacterium]MBI2972627.1 Ku protein [Armatimonadota bacterium]